MSGAEVFLALIVGAFIAVMALALSIVPVWPQNYPGDPPVHRHSSGEISGLRGEFYSTWMRPDNPSMSCCNTDDCDYADARFENGQWSAKHQGEEGERSPIPDAKVEKKRTSPDGAAHLCKRSSWPRATIYCFIAPAGS